MNAILLVCTLLASPAVAYPEFQVWIKSNSGRGVDCAFCHVSGDGPDGSKPGQIEALSPAELDALGRARAAFEPGAGVDSPILGDFGDEILNRLGRTKIESLRNDPASLPDLLEPASDLDQDGIPDAVEMRDGTHPLDPNHGAPLRLLRNNLEKHALTLVLTLLATLSGLYGLHHLLGAFWSAERHPHHEDHP
jgi:hypothetical protein